MAMDLKLLYFLNSLVGKSKFIDALIIFFGQYFSYLLIIIFCLFLYFLKRDQKTKLSSFIITIVSALALSSALTYLIRFLYHRPRPFTAFAIKNLLVETSYSFPSHHATFFFTMATVIYLYNKNWGRGFFIAALIICLSRIIAGIHYPSDILGGMIIGVLAGYLTSYLIKKLSL
jgi:undecaprenyl-diphosphatase